MEDRCAGATDDERQNGETNDWATRDDDAVGSPADAHDVAAADVCVHAHVHVSLPLDVDSASFARGRLGPRMPLRGARRPMSAARRLQNKRQRAEDEAGKRSETGEEGEDKSERSFKHTRRWNQKRGQRTCTRVQLATTLPSPSLISSCTLCTESVICPDCWFVPCLLHLSPLLLLRLSALLRH